MKNCWRRNVRPIKVIAVVAAIAATVLTATGSRANTLPAQAECIAPAKAGGGFDLTCKLTRQMLAGAKPLTISYLPGGIGALAFSTFAAKRRNEAGTLVAFSSGSLLNLAQGKFGPYSESDARWLAVVGVDYGAIAVRKDSPYRTLADLARALKADPRSVVFGAGGTIGSQDWIKAALLTQAAGANPRSMRFVAFEGGGDALQALEGGHVSVVAGDAAEVSQQLARSDRIRLLAVLSKQRVAGVFAGVPTAREQGFDIVWPIARGLYLGPGVSDAAYREWQELMRKALTASDYPQQLAAHGLHPGALIGAELRAFIDDSMAQYRRLAAEFQLGKGTTGR